MRGRSRPRADVPHRLYVVRAPDGREYVGMTNAQLVTRWRGHLLAARDRYQRSDDGLQGVILEHGPDAFVIEQIASARNRCDAQEAERLLIEQRCTLAPHGLNLRQWRPSPSNTVKTGEGG